MKTRTRELSLGSIAVALGTTTTVLAARLPNDTGTAVGPGAFPLVVGVSITLAGLFIVVPALGRSDGVPPVAAQPPAQAAPEAARPESRWVPVALPVGALVFCVAAVSLSLTIVTAAAFTLCGRYMAGYRWRTACLIGLLGAVVVYVIFRVLLDVPLPDEKIW